MVGKKTSEPQKAAAKAPEGAPTKAQKVEPPRKVESDSEEEEVVSGSESGNEAPIAARGKVAPRESESSEEAFDEDDDESFEDEEEEEESDESYEEPPKAQGRKRGRARNSDDD